MLNKIIQYSFVVLLALILVIVQFSLISAFNHPFNSINILVVMLVLSFLIVSKEKVYLLALSAGWFMDIFSFHPFGSTTLSLLLSALLTYFVLENFLTNRSLYSFLFLAIVAIIADSILRYTLIIVFSWPSQQLSLFFLENSFWSSLLWSLIFALLFIVFSFHFLIVLNKKLKPFFLNKL